MTHDPRKALADELKPCPFCGANAMSANSEDGEIMVLCSDEQCKAQPWVCGLNKEEAAHRWIKSISEDDLASEIWYGEYDRDTYPWTTQSSAEQLTYRHQAKALLKLYSIRSLPLQSPTEQRGAPIVQANTCYLERSAVRTTLIGQPDIGPMTIRQALGDIDALPIFTASDFRSVTAEQSPKFKGPICCYCDNVLSCAHCGREQPDDSALPAAEQRAELIPLADHDDIGRKVLNQPWAIQSAIVTIAAHCRVLLDKYPTGDAADLAGCISQDCLELTNALPAPVNREPTEKQLNAARDWSRDKYGKPIGNEAAMGCWQTMFDALTPPERGE